MFKNRKLQSHHQLATRNSTHRPAFNQTQKSLVVNQYSIIAKSLMHELSQQVELAVLKKGTFQDKATELFTCARKCDYQTKCLILVKLFNLYRLQRIRLAQNLEERVQDFITYLLLLVETNEHKLCDFILMENIAQTIAFTVKCYSHKKDALIPKLRPILEKFNQLQNRINRKLPKKQYDNFIKTVNYLNQSCLAKKPSEAKNNSKEVRPSCISSHSVASKISDSKQAIVQRLRKFDETRQNEEFRAKLQALSQGKKKKNFKRSNSIVHVSTKRISTTWGRHDSINISNGGKQAMKKSEGSSGVSKFTASGPRKSLFLYQNLLAIEKLVAKHHQSQRAPVQQMVETFRPFYIFTIIKDNLRVIRVKQAEITAETQKLKVYFEGYFNYPIIFHKFPSLFLQSIESEQLKRFILSHVKLKQKLMWNVLYPILKNTAQEYCNKNVISELLCQNENFKFFGFVKKFNAFFFTRYESENQKSSEGILAIHNSNLEEHLQEIKVTNWKRNESLGCNSFEGIESSKTLDELENRSITVSDYNIRLRAQQNTNKRSNIDRKIKQKLMKRPKVGNKVFHVVKKDKKFVVLDEEWNGKQKVYSNLISEPKYHNLFVAHSRCIEDQSMQKFVLKINRKNQWETLSVLNRKTSSLAYVKIRYEFSFIKKIKQLGYVLCRIFLFKPEQSQLILAEAYVQQNQKYYTFSLKSSIFNEYLNLDFANFTNQNIHDCLACLVKLIRIRKAENSKRDSGDLGLVLEIGDLVIQGQQLLFQVCFTDKAYSPQYIDSFTLKNGTHSDLHNHIEIQRETHKVSMDLRNQIVQTHHISNPRVLKKYGKYNEFLKQIKLELRQFNSPRALFGRDTKAHFYFPCRNSYSSNNLSRVEVHQKSVKLVQFYKNSDLKELEIDLSEEKCDSAWKMMLSRLCGGEKRAITRYMGRLIRDPLMARVLTGLEAA